MHFENQQSHLQTLWHRLEKPLTALFLTAGLSIAASVTHSQASEIAAIASDIPTAEVATIAQVVEPILPNGVYLYGQAQEPDQIGSAYLVFEVNDSQVVGAFYMPSSSFDCFYGEVETNQLMLTIVSSYEQESYPYAIALEENSNVAAAGDAAIEPMTLEGYYHLDTVSENDQRILGMCRTEI